MCGPALTLVLPQAKRAALIYTALRNPVVSYHNDVLKIGDFPININQFGSARSRIFETARRTGKPIVETIPLTMQIAWLKALLGSAEEAMYCAHSEICDNRLFRPCVAICAEYGKPLCWEIAAFSRDPGNVGQLVAIFASTLAPQSLEAVAAYAKTLALHKPVCPMLDICLRACGIDPQKASDADMICALVMAVASYTGQFARAYHRGCSESNAAVCLIEQACPHLQPRLLGLLSPVLSDAH